MFEQPTAEWYQRGGYKIVRIFRDERNGERRRPRTIKRGLTLAEAQAYCRDPQTNSRTAKGARARRYTELHGTWFDGYEHDGR
jgi:hypothetical protein